jgi:hypothetical protein
VRQNRLQTVQSILGSVGVLDPSCSCFVVMQKTEPKYYAILAYLSAVVMSSDGQPEPELPETNFIGRRKSSSFIA